MRNKARAIATMVRLLERARYEVLPTASIEERCSRTSPRSTGSR